MAVSKLCGPRTTPYTSGVKPTDASLLTPHIRTATVMERFLKRRLRLEAPISHRVASHFHVTHARVKLEQRRMA
jgi:hypothetical protein